MEKDKITGFKVVLIGGSAGSLDVLLKILPHLEPNLPFALLIVLHRKDSEDSTLEELIALKTNIPVTEVEDKVMVRPGNIYIAPGGYHLLFEKNGELSLDTSEKVHYSRPSIDVAFQSGADAYGPKIAAVLLSGANSDGTMGLMAIREAGGTVVVQQPETADVPFMPAYAIKNIVPDHILDIGGILGFINHTK